MPRRKTPRFNVLVIGQAGRLQCEAALFCASLRVFSPKFDGRLFVAEPQPGPLWPKDPRISDDGVRAVLDRLGAEILPFENHAFGASYPYGNKIEALAALPDEPFVFFDSDTLITGELSGVPFDFDRPSASLRREGTWPRIELYGPGYAAIWGALYDRFGLDFESSLDLSHPDEYWKRYLYFNAGWFYYRDPAAFHERFRDYAVSIRDDPPEALVCQELDPWLDQVALPLVIHSFGGGRDALKPGFLDGSVSCHYRHLPLLYARESDAVVAALEEVARPNWLKKVLKAHEPMRRMIYQGKGAKARALFDRADLPRREQAIRNTLKREKLWLR
ncbi:hypothetical protein HKCCE3408_14790 [Rhodobacterales bacterium HKCCE3408]|nr:hypothetical protein [Rhodobacterales bacterium HKCCE3408]